MGKSPKIKRSRSHSPPQVEHDDSSDSDDDDYDDENRSTTSSTSSPREQFETLRDLIGSLSTENPKKLSQILERKGKKVIIEYEYNMTRSSSQSSWKPTTTPVTSTVNKLLDNWKYEGDALQRDTLFMTLLPDKDLRLRDFKDLKQRVLLFSNIADKYITYIVEVSDVALESFEIMADNLARIQSALDDVSQTITDKAEDTEAKNDMEKLIASSAKKKKRSKNKTPPAKKSKRSVSSSSSQQFSSDEGEEEEEEQEDDDEDEDVEKNNSRNEVVELSDSDNSFMK